MEQAQSIVKKLLQHRVHVYYAQTYKQTICFVYVPFLLEL